MADGCVGVVGDPQPHIRPPLSCPDCPDLCCTTVCTDTRLLPLEPNPSQRLVRLVPCAAVTE
eukprot:4742742-Prymnesium_polylepis.1